MATLDEERRRLQKAWEAERDPARKRRIRSKLDNVRQQISQSKQTTQSTPETGGGLTLNTPEGIIDAQTKLNRVNEDSPFGTNEYIRNPDGSYTQKTKLQEGEQKKLDQDRQRDIGLGDTAQGLADRVGKSYAEEFNLDGINFDPNNFDYTNERKRLEDVFLKRFDEVNNQRYSQESEGLRQSLANKGIPEGSELYNREMERLSRQQGDERRGALVDALSYGGSEADRAFNTGLAGRQATIQDRLLVRDRPFQELTNVLSQRGGVNLPEFQPRSEIDVAGINQSFQDNQFRYDSLAQERDLANKQMRQQWKIANLNRGGGGGRGSSPMWAQAGFKSPLEYDEYQRNRAREDQQWQWQNDPRYRQQRTSTRDVLGGVLGNFAGGLAQGVGGWFK